VKRTASIGRQTGDFLIYILLPLVCVVLPYTWGQALIRQVSQRGWLLNARSDAALRAALEYIEVPDQASWKQRWRLAEMFEARDLWLCMLGRGQALTKRVRVHGIPLAADRLVMLGMHWGPSVLALRMFHQAGLAPRFVYRAVPAELLRAAPFHYAYLTLLVAYIRRVCRQRDIRVPGARKELTQALAEPGTPVILLDAPITRDGRALRGQILDQDADFFRDGLELLTTARARCVLYAMGMDENGANVLTCSNAFEPESPEALLQRYTAMMSRCLAGDSAQWRLWHAAGQLFRGPTEKTEAAGQTATTGQDASSATIES